jgi:3-oxosteroid 1-dehydrogenase
MTDLVVEDGRVVGAVVERDGVPVRVGARLGVLLASGGFEHNSAMRADHLPEGGRADHSLGARENTGDGILAGQRLGAAVDLMDDAWWMPSVEHPAGATIPLVSERAIPGHVIVSADGRRFTNEASPYVNFVHDQLAGKHDPAWFVMDARARSRYPFAQVLPGRPFPADFYRAGIVHRADTIEALAASIGVPAEALVATVTRFNELARSGIDADFGRGSSAHDRYYGDPTLPNPNLHVVDKAPFYAVRIQIGDLGTKGGLVCDEHARVLRDDDSVIEGLYATGNASASVMANEYAGPGATIGPAMVFGYLAARHAAGGREG